MFWISSKNNFHALALERILRQASKIKIDCENIVAKHLDLSILGFKVKIIFAFWQLKVLHDNHLLKTLIITICSKRFRLIHFWVASKNNVRVFALESILR